MSVTRYCETLDFVRRHPQWRERILAGESPPLEGSWEPSETFESDEPAPALAPSVGPKGPTGAAERGTLFHAVMEATTLDWSEALYFSELTREAKAMGLAPEARELAFLAAKALAFQKSEDGRLAAEALAAGRLVRREWPFWLRLEGDELGEGVIHLSGVVDLFFVDADGAGRIVDYKLAPSRNPRRGAYKRQMELYARAIVQAGFLGPGRLTAKLWYSEN
jgi:ATP-dependent exoDNAse (exonuclease V) beta subunit